MSLTAKGTTAFKGYVAYLESIVAPKKEKNG
jgi:hypothetical protein